MAIVKAIAGHMNARMTDDCTHIGSAVKREAVNRIGEAYQSVMDILCIEDSGWKRVNRSGLVGKFVGMSGPHYTLWL